MAHHVSAARHHGRIGVARVGEGALSMPGQICDGHEQD